MCKMYYSPVFSSLISLLLALRCCQLISGLNFFSDYSENPNSYTQFEQFCDIHAVG